MIYQLVYVSRATAEVSEEELDALLDQARTNNARVGVTGMLLYHEGGFIQVLEGEESQVNEIYSRIDTDPRHSDPHIVLRHEIEERSFEDWSMGYKRTGNARDIPEGFHHFLAQGFRRSTEDDQKAARKALLAFKEGRWRI
ncbi:MAG: BLUF domain-containing protein [Pseudomonadaceae bacterium]|nr:BLUF domain-containing protein [Pseudomonadaceae bacterium]